MPRVRARLEADGTVIQRRADGSWQPVECQADWARVDATSEAVIARQAAEDDVDAAREGALWARRVRRRTGLSQVKFAGRIGVPLSTARGWERGDPSPRGAARALLQVIDRIPEAVLAALAA